MRILIFSTAYLPFIGGAELAIREIAERLSCPFNFPRFNLESEKRLNLNSSPSKAGEKGTAGDGISFTLITARLSHSLPRRERIGAVEVCRVGFGSPLDKWLLPFLGLWKARQLERAERFDAAWAMMASQGSIAAAWFKGCFPNVRLVLTLQEGDEESHLERYALESDFLYRALIRPWHLLVFQRADAVTAISNYLAERARRALAAVGRPEVPVVVVPNGVAVEKFRVESLELKVEDIRMRLGLTAEDKAVITVSRLAEKNGVGDLIEAMRHLPENVKLLILGSGELEEGLKLKTASLRLVGRVQFLGAIQHSEVPSYLHCAHVFARPSRSEGMGSAFLEAMAAGVPVVATPVGGIPDFLSAPLPGSSEERHLFSNSHELENSWRDAITGVFCRAGDSEDIAAKIRLLLERDALRRRIVENAERLMRERYDWQEIAEKMREVFTGGQSDKSRLV